MWMKERLRWNSSREVTWPIGKLLFFCFIFALPTTAQVAKSEGHAKAGKNLGFKSPSASDIDRAIVLAAGYLERACRPDGRFTYMIDINSGQQSPSYNIVRHAGAIYALGMLQYPKPDKQALDAMTRASFFLRRNYVGPGVRQNQLVVWSKPLPQNSTADLGATGLGLVALTSVDRANPNSVPLSQLQALGHFLLFLQKSDGSFVSKYSAQSGAVGDFQSLYYPGEAALGLIDLYELDHSVIWLNAAAEALSYLARSRAKLSSVPPDHWALIATAKLLPYYGKSESAASREALVYHAIQISQSMMNDQVRASADALDGAFDAAGQTAPTATRMEGLLAALEFLPEGRLRSQIKVTVHHGIAFLLRSEISNGTYAGGMPAANGPPGAFVRIDFVQHALCAWLRYRQFLISES